MAEATGLKIMVSRSTSMASPPTEFHKNLLISSKVNGGVEVKDTETGK
jgi:hypothetical protein